MEFDVRALIGELVIANRLAEQRINALEKELSHFRSDEKKQESVEKANGSQSSSHKGRQSAEGASRDA